MLNTNNLISPSSAIDKTLFSAIQFNRLSESIAILEDRKLELSSISFIICARQHKLKNTMHLKKNKVLKITLI